MQPLVGNCDVRPLCALRRLCCHPSASAPSVADKLANNLYVQIKLMWNWSVAVQSIATATWRKKKINLSVFWAKVVYIAFGSIRWVVKFDEWGNKSDSSSGVQFHFPAGEQQQGGAVALQRLVKDSLHEWARASGRPDIGRQLSSL